MEAAKELPVVQPSQLQSLKADDIAPTTSNDKVQASTSVTRSTNKELVRKPGMALELKRAKKSDDTASCSEDSLGENFERSDCGFNEFTHDTLIHVGERIFYFAGYPSKGVMKVMNEIGDSCENIARGMCDMQKELEGEDEFENTDNVGKFEILYEKLSLEAEDTKKRVGKELEKEGVDDVEGAVEKAVESAVIL